MIQESVLSVWLSLKSFKLQSSFRTWVIGIVRYKIADYFRKLYKTQFSPISEFEDFLIADDEIGNVVSKMDVEQAAKTLNNIEKEIVFLSFTAHLTYFEISQITQIPVGTIKSKMSSIKNKLRRQLQEGE